MLCPLATTLNHHWKPGTDSRLLSIKPEEWMHLLPMYTRVHGEWLRYAKSTSQYSLAFSIRVRDDWGFQVNPHNVITTKRLCSLHQGMRVMYVTETFSCHVQCRLGVSN